MRLSRILPTMSIVLLMGFATWFVYDLLFSKPEIHEGVIVEMHFVEGRVQSGQFRLGSRARPQLMSTQRHDRWIAVVRMESGDTTLVECKKHHFDGKSIGGTLKFKEFQGGTFEIKYFAHSEEQ